MKIILAFAFLSMPFLVKAQIDPELLLGINTATSAEISAIPVANISEGTLIYNSDLKSLLHFNNTRWVVVSDEANATKITNELIFESTPYYYVSMIVNTSSWLVIRYDKTDVNAEAKATGTNNQPTSLAECATLTYL